MGLSRRAHAAHGGVPNEAVCKAIAAERAPIRHERTLSVVVFDAVE